MRKRGAAAIARQHHGMFALLLIALAVAVVAAVSHRRASVADSLPPLLPTALPADQFAQAQLLAQFARAQRLSDQR
jgi:hypothetical protein